MLLAPILSGAYDFVIGSRTRGERERGSMSLHQIMAGYVAGSLTRLLYGVTYTDIVRVPRHPARSARAARHARNDLWVEPGDADASGGAPACASWSCRSPINVASAALPRYPAPSWAR